MKDAENVKNYYKTEVEPYSILPRAYHVIDGLLFIATQNTHIHCSLPSETKGDSDCKPNLRSNETKHVLYHYKYLPNLITLYHNESKSNI